jgi:hypothetical protein
VIPEKKDYPTISVMRMGGHNSDRFAGSISFVVVSIVAISDQLWPVRMSPQLGVNLSATPKMTRDTKNNL